MKLCTLALLALLPLFGCGAVSECEAGYATANETFGWDNRSPGGMAFAISVASPCSHTSSPLFSVSTAKSIRTAAGACSPCPCAGFESALPTSGTPSVKGWYDGLDSSQKAAMCAAAAASPPLE